MDHPERLLMAPQPTNQNSDLADEAFLRAMTFPEEERAQLDD